MVQKTMKQCLKCQNETLQYCGPRTLMLMDRTNTLKFATRMKQFMYNNTLPLTILMR